MLGSVQALQRHGVCKDTCRTLTTEHPPSGHNKVSEIAKGRRSRRAELVYREGETFLDRLAEVLQSGLDKADVTLLKK